MNAIEPLRHQAKHRPDSVAYASAHGTLVTYAVMEDTINAVAHRLRDLGCLPGQNAAIGTNDLYRYIVVALALARLGIAHAPIALPAHLTDVAFLDRDVPGNGCARTVAFGDFWPEDPRSHDVAPVTPHEGGAAILMYCPSSGTTGGPKFVPVSHDLALRRVHSRAVDLAGFAGGRGITSLRLACHIRPGTSYGFSSVFMVLCGGGTVLEPNLDAGELASWLVQSRVNFIVTSPIALQKITEVLPTLRSPNALEKIEVSGSALPARVYELARLRMCANIIVNYGMTECGRVSGMPAALAQGRPGAAGYPYSGVEIRIVDEGGAPVAAGQEGIVAIRSEGNASSYLGDPKASAAAFRGGWVFGGDRGLLEPDGLLRIVGRTDDVINRGGVKVNPQTIEDAMMAIADLREVAVFGVPDANGLTRICAAIVPASSVDANAFHLRCRERLGTSAPVVIMHMQELPRNATGKVLRNELARMAIEARNAQKAQRIVPVGET